MIIYNVTTQIAHAIHSDWLKWMHEKHIPDVMATGFFTGYRFVRILEVDETDGPMYALQFYAASREQYDAYIEHHAEVLRGDVKKMWGENYFSFRSLMEEVEIT